MTTTPALRRLSVPSENGIRPFDLARDLRPVASLISNAFAHELDHRGTAILREMRFMSYLAGFMRFFNGDTINYDDVFSGFVWVDENKVIGNVTVQRADNTGKRWQIANVAVAPEFRGKGIASRLIHQALAHVKESRGDSAVLQVYENNHIARSLYEKLGFENMGGVVELRANRVPYVTPPLSIPNFGTFRSNQWRSLYQLAGSQPNAQNKWWRNLRRTDFQMTFEEQCMEWFWRIIGRTSTMRRCVRVGTRFDAAIILTAQRWSGEHKIRIWSRPDVYGKFEAYLARWALAELQDYPRFPISLTVSTEYEATIKAFQHYDFQRKEALLTMRRKINH